MDLQCIKEVVCLMSSLLESLVQKQKRAYLLLSQLKMQILNLVFSYPCHSITGLRMTPQRHFDSFDVISCQVDSEIGDEGNEEEDGPTTNPLRLHRLMSNQRESVAHFFSGRAFLPARNERIIREQHHRPRSGVPPHSGFLFSIEG